MFGYTEEELRLLLAPMATAGAEPLGSMGTDTPLAALSSRPRLLYDYFTQLFAQVTNPPLDAIREELVTSLAGSSARSSNLLEPGPASCRQLVLPAPGASTTTNSPRSGTSTPTATCRDSQCALIDGRYRVHGGGRGAGGALERVRRGVLRGRRRRRPHPHPVRPGLRRRPRADPVVAADLGGAPPPGAAPARTQVGLIVETGDCREVHHVALLIGYGAAAVNPYLAFETIEDLVADGAHHRDEPDEGRRATTSRRCPRAC